jgi:hypothetical protein
VYPRKQNSSTPLDEAQPLVGANKSSARDSDLLLMAEVGFPSNANAARAFQRKIKEEDQGRRPRPGRYSHYSFGAGQKQMISR